jgi:hypothetical protein
MRDYLVSKWYQSDLLTTRGVGYDWSDILVL